MHRSFGLCRFNFVFGNGNRSVFHALFDMLIKVLQSDHKSSQFIIFIIGTCFLNASIAKNKDTV